MLNLEKLQRNLTSRNQMSEAFITAAILAISGGFQDAYTYNLRDHVFANAQTGNIVLMSQHFMSGEIMKALSYLFPILAFGIGVFIAEQIQYKYKNSVKIHWRQGILLAEILILFVVGFIPLKYSLLANILVSLSCAMQVQTFRKVGNYAYASTMCIGNLRSGTAALSAYIRSKNPASLRQATYYFAIIIIFAIGAGIGGICSLKFGPKTIWCSCIILLISFLLMFLNYLEEETQQESK